MAPMKNRFNWSAVSKKLQQEKKADLINLIQELTVVSPEAQRFLQARYLQKKQPADRVAAYCKVIQGQFTISEWNNTLSWNFAGVQKAIDDYDRGSRGDGVGLLELMVFALETAVAFADRLNLHDDDFDVEITELAERCISLFTEHPKLSPQYINRLKKIEQIGNGLGFYALGETLDELTNPFR